MQLYPYMLTYGGPQLLVLFVIFVVSPIVYRRYLKKRERRIQILSLLGLWAMAILIAYGDVYLIAREAQRLCRDEAGMHFYRTIQATGVLGAGTIREVQDLGIEFVEWKSPLGRPLGRQRVVNGEYVTEKISDFMSQVELTATARRISKHVVETKDVLVDRNGNTILAEIVAFKFYPGWIDARLLGMIAFSWAPPRCDDNYAPRQEKNTHLISELMRKTINPK